MYAEACGAKGEKSSFYLGHQKKLPLKSWTLIWVLFSLLGIKLLYGPHANFTEKEALQKGSIMARKISQNI